LGDQDADVRGTAVELLGKIGAFHSEALSILAPQLRREDPGDFRARVAHAFGRAGRNAATALPALLQALSSGDPHIRFAGLWALGEIGPARPGVLEALTRALEDPAAATHYIAAGHAIEGQRKTLDNRNQVGNDGNVVSTGAFLERFLAIL
jgi:HEAT repeat protein